MDFDTIYREYFQTIYYYLRSLTSDPAEAEELTQETFFKVLKAVDQLDTGKNVRAWLFTIAKNTYLDACRKNQRQPHIPLSEQMEETTPSFTDRCVEKETAFQIHSLLHEMPEPYKEVFSLRVFGELDYEQIARLFGKSSGWARVTYYRAKQKLQMRMEEIEHEKHSLSSDTGPAAVIHRSGRQ